MKRKPQALDLFCGAGGATRGLQLAGYHVTGVDIRPQPRYCGDAFHQADAMEFPLDGYDLIWASPPCQRFSSASAMKGTSAQHPDLIAPMRRRLIASGAPYIIENVPGAPLIHPVLLCGTMFPPLRVFRHRLFETSFFLFSPPHGKHPRVHVVNPPFRRGAPLSSRMVANRAAYGPEEWVSVAGHSFLAEHGRAAMGIEWMTRDELAQAIPPAYSHFIALASPALQREAVTA